jgi:DNA polymerase-1
MREVYLTGQDIHDRTSMEVFGTMEKAMRRKAKIIAFGLSYCMSAGGYARQAGVSLEQGEQDLRKFFNRYARIEPFREEFWAACRNGQPPGAFTNMFGRPRRLPELLSGNKWDRGRAERQAIGSLIQGTAAQFTKESLVRIWKWEQVARSGLLLRTTIHDDIQYDIPKAHALPVARAVVALMEDFPEFAPIPIVVDVETSDTDWSRKHELPEGWRNP